MTAQAKIQPEQRLQLDNSLGYEIFYQLLDLEAVLLLVAEQLSFVDLQKSEQYRLQQTLSEI